MADEKFVELQKTARVSAENTENRSFSRLLYRKKGGGTGCYLYYQSSLVLLSMVLDTDRKWSMIWDRDSFCRKRVVWQLMWFQVNDCQVNCESLSENIWFGTANHLQWTPTAGLDHQGSRTHFIRARTTSRHGWNLGAALMGQSRLHGNIYPCRAE